MVKANAYGLGSDIVGREIEDLVDYFAVARLSEGILLRRAGIKKTNPHFRLCRLG